VDTHFSRRGLKKWKSSGARSFVLTQENYDGGGYDGNQGKGGLNPIKGGEPTLTNKEEPNAQRNARKQTRSSLHIRKEVLRKVLGGIRYIGGGMQKTKGEDETEHTKKALTGKQGRVKKPAPTNTQRGRGNQRDPRPKKKREA